MYQLCRALSAIPVDHKKLSDILDEVADFHQPKVQERGYFQLKPEWWTKFDPLFAQFYPNELEDAQERAGHVGKQQFYWRIGLPHKALPPYNRLTNLLHTQVSVQSSLIWNLCYCGDCYYFSAQDSS
jgi:E3 ubiquitin-protein ligase UBR1/E3 ubiquitin-protein ligase UBR3